MTGVCVSFTLASHQIQAADSTEAAPKSRGALTFEADVLPILKAKCVRCHNPKARKADLDLTSMAALSRGGESGEVITAEDEEESTLLDMVVEGAMPPDGEETLTDEEIALIRSWIASGAKSRAASQTTSQITQHDIVPIMYLRCTVCHGLRKQEAGLDLRSKASMLKGGKSGPAIALGKPDESLLLARIHAGEMPPAKLLVDFGVRPIGESEVAMISKWIAAGAPEVEITEDVATTDPDPLVSPKDRQFWAFQPPQRPAVPTFDDSTQIRNPIDAFVFRKLAASGLTLSAEADRLTLIRRVAFDLTGLPPTPEEVEEFLVDRTPDAYERMVDRYLDSPRYGERWGRHWLDIVGYADSEGKRSADTLRPHAWRYRDYVIRAVNDDKPYDRFLLEQLAGDELVDYEHAVEFTDEMMDNLVATGFMRMAPDGTGSDIVNTVVERREVIGDQIDIFSSVVLGLTVKCAACHSHKYDPIPQRDYYRLAATFKGAFDEYDWMPASAVAGQTKNRKQGRVLALATESELQKWRDHNAPIEAKIKQLQQKVDERAGEVRARLIQQQLDKLPEVLREDLRAMLSTPKKQRNSVQKYLADKFEASLTFKRAQLINRDVEFRKLSQQTEREIKQAKENLHRRPAIRALWDRGEPSPSYIYRRGEHTNPGRLVGPGVLSVLTAEGEPFDVQPPWPYSKKTGRRLALAKWVTKPDHPLTARVEVNRIWKGHFGTGIVKSLSNFGNTGVPPTHPELLDWLAVEFVEHGWSVKHMHRLMLNSSTYRQSSAVTDEQLAADPENKLLSHMTLTRMDAETVRDSILAVSGRLNFAQFGPPDQINVRPDGLVTSRETNGGWRRSVYVLQRRKEVLTILENFDLPQMNPNCIERPESTVASQALHLMNNGMIRQLADDFAERVAREAGENRRDRISRAYWLALSRPPSDQEIILGEEALAKMTAFWQSQPGEEKQAKIRALSKYCHMLLNSAAFLFID